MKTILIIEDDVIYARSIGNWLRKQEMGSERVTTLSAARKSLSDREYDLVLADLRLPTATARTCSGGCTTATLPPRF